MTVGTDELRALDPQPETVKLTTGTQVVIEDLRARQFFKLLRIVTHGAMGVFKDLSLLPNPGDSSEVFMGRLLGLMLMSIPDAEDETIEFVRSMCSPVGVIPGGRRLSKQDVERNAELWARLDTELDNPELDDLITIIEAIIRRESDDIQALGKRLAGMLKLAEKTGQLPEGLREQPTSTSSADSPGPTTSSQVSTDGETSTSAS